MNTPQCYATFGKFQDGHKEFLDQYQILLQKPVVLFRNKPFWLFKNIYNEPLFCPNKRSKHTEHLENTSKKIQQKSR
jgi:hypothetical protein